MMHILIVVLVLAIVVLLALLVLFPKQTIILLMIIGGISAVSYYYYNNSEKERKAELNKIVIKASASKTCLEPITIQLSIHNGTNKKLDSVDFTLTAKEMGFSSEIISSDMKSEKIINPTETYVTCWPAVDSSLKHGNIIGYDFNKVNWVTSVKRAKFAE